MKEGNLEFQCSRCGIIKVPILKDSEKAKIIHFKKNIGPMHAINFVRNTYGFELSESKNLINHINSKTGECLVCKVSDIEGENKNCPNCGRFTLNWDHEKLKAFDVD